MPERLLAPFVVGVTSLLGVLVVGRCLKLSVRTLGIALIRMVETIGAGVVFLLLNMVVGLVVLLAARSLLPRFVPLYPAGDIAIIVLSFVQGLAFECWRSRRRCP